MVGTEKPTRAANSSTLMQSTCDTGEIIGGDPKCEWCPYTYSAFSISDYVIWERFLAMEDIRWCTSRIPFQRKYLSGRCDLPLKSGGMLFTSRFPHYLSEVRRKRGSDVGEKDESWKIPSFLAVDFEIASVFQNCVLKFSLSMSKLISYSRVLTNVLNEFSCFVFGRQFKFLNDRTVIPSFMD